ncbi:MAG: hypothetical protein DMD82_10685 [Candidatus Rokuibacteriota bacterium]|nr:MAG: hypothetical protein DMD82_10685 [Candidatus Rokubacteria bacterium]
MTPAIVDNSQRIDVNRIGMFVTNTGSFAWDKTTLVAGLEFPRGSGKTAVFAAGPWIGAMVGGETRVALSEYSDEYGPGSMIGGAPDDPSRPEYKVYKLNRVYSSAAERDAALADYNAGAVPHGAPAITVQPDGSLDVPGDQMTWCVYNDADPRSHGNRAGQTQPLGVEVQETFYAYDDPGPLGNTVFLRFKIFNKGANFLEQTYVGLWSDPDVGGALDDLVGADPGRSLGFAYNAYGLDAIYASAAPAVGFDLLRGPLASPSGPPLGLTAITSYINGTDPNDASKSYRALQGLDASGNPFVDPTTGLTTRFMFPGDPLAGTGWIDVTPTDHRFLLGSGPFSLSPGESEDIEYAATTTKFKRSSIVARPPRVRCRQPVSRSRTASRMQTSGAMSASRAGACSAPSSSRRSRSESMRDRCSSNGDPIRPEASAPPWPGPERCGMKQRASSRPSSRISRRAGRL